MLVLGFLFFFLRLEFFFKMPSLSLNDKISVTIDNKLANISLNRPFNLQAIIANTSKNQDDLPIVMDKLDYSGNEQGAKLALLEPKVVDAESELSNLAMNETKK